jgi:diacylglycerol kinase (ATP)
MQETETRIQFLFIINPISGTTRKHNITEMIFSTLNVNRDDIKIVLTRYAGHAKEIAQEAAAQGVPNIISVGGDGTMNEVASSLLHTKSNLGIIPLGSGNGLARHLGIPLNPQKAIDLLNNFEIKTIDTGAINSIPFFCTAGIGLDAQVTKMFDELPTRGLKTYIKAFVKKVRTYKGDPLTIHVNDHTEIKGTFLISTFANANQYGNNAFIAPTASLSDQQLNLILIKPVSILQAIAKIYKLFFKKIHKDPNIEYLLFKKIDIHRPNQGPAHIDGEPLMLGTHITVACIGNALRVITPKSIKK